MKDLNHEIPNTLFFLSVKDNDRRRIKKKPSISDGQIEKHNRIPKHQTDDKGRKTKTKLFIL